MTIVDHAFFLIIAGVYPITSYVNFRRLMRRIESGEIISRSYLYNMTLRSHWLLFAVGIVIWVASQRSWSELGFGLVFDMRFLVGAALTVIVIIALLLQLRRMAGASPSNAATLRRQLGRIEFICPTDDSELNRFYGLSVTAGIVEETLWRGFLFWYLGHFMPLWGAAIVSSIGFGLAHAYQGVSKIPQVALVGSGFSALYLISGSLWLPMLLHAVFDIVQGRVVYTVIRRTNIGVTPDAAASR